MVTSSGVSTDPTLELRLLGELAIYRDGSRLKLPQSKKTRALLGYLVLSARPQRRARLCSLLWDVADDPRAALRWSLSKLRPLVNDAKHTRLVADRETVAFESIGISIDIIEARKVLSGDLEAVDTDTLVATANSFRGELLEGLVMTDFDEYQAWCLAQREDARAQHVRLLRTLVDRLREQPTQALPYARALVNIEPIDELLRAQLVQMLVAVGRADEARQQRELAERQLQELGVPLRGALRTALDDMRATAPPSASPPPATAPPPTMVDDARMVGRTAEQARLSNLLQRVAQTGHESVALISGEPGVGKTRLLIALLDDVRNAGGLVLEGRAYEAERGRPLGPWIDALRRAPAVALSDATASHLAPLFGDETGAPSGTTQSQMFQAVADWIGAHANQRLLVALALDDVQWLDDASAELLHYVARCHRESRLLIALTARAGEMVDNESLQRVLRAWRRAQLVDQVELGPLSHSDISSLIAGVSTLADADWVYAQSAGNPLFALELARSGVQDDGPMAPTLTEVVRARIARLPSEAGDVLRWLSVFGASARIAQLENAIALPLEQLMGALEAVERHALVTAHGDRYSFSHDLVRHVVYGELSEPRRRLMHLRIAQRLQAEGAEEHAADIAHHANLAGDAAMAARACISAGRRSLKLFAYRDALALAKRGRRFVDQLEEPERTKLTIELWDVRLAAETPPDSEAVARELEALAEQATDVGCLVHARMGFHLLSYLRWEGGRSADARRHMLHAEQLTRGGDDRHRAEALAEAARCLVRLDLDMGHAQALALEAHATATRLGVEPPEVTAAAGMLSSYKGEIEQAIAELRESQASARRQQDRLNEFFALEWIVMLLLQAERWSEARQESERLLALGDRLREGSEGPCARALAAVAALGDGVEGAGDRFEAAAAELRTVDAKHRLGWALLMVASLELARDPEAARRRAEEGLALVRIVSHRSDTAWATALCARAARACADDEAYRAHLAALRDLRPDELAAHARRAVQDVL